MLKSDKMDSYRKTGITVGIKEGGKLLKKKNLISGGLVYLRTFPGF